MQYSVLINQVGKNLATLQEDIHSGNVDNMRRKIKFLADNQDKDSLEFMAQMIVDAFRAQLLLIMREEREKQLAENDNK